jgi:hypothetical protein
MADESQVLLIDCDAVTRTGIKGVLSENFLG